MQFPDLLHLASWSATALDFSFWLVTAHTKSETHNAKSLVLYNKSTDNSKYVFQFSKTRQKLDFLQYCHNLYAPSLPRLSKHVFSQKWHLNCAKYSYSKPIAIMYCLTMSLATYKRIVNCFKSLSVLAYKNETRFTNLFC